MKTMLFSPGPVMTRDNVRQSLLHADICHRSPEFEEMYVDTLQKINQLFKADDTYQSVIISGSGTSANETVISSIFHAGEEAVLIRNGEFGNRLKEIYDQYGIGYTDCSFEWGTIIDLDAVEKAVAASGKATAVHMVFHETSTSMINPVKAVGEIADKYGKMFCVDCVSAAGGEDIDIVDMKITFATSVGGKCVGAYPGSAYVCGKKDVMDKLTSSMGRNIYLNLARHYIMAVTRRQTPNTPNVTLFWALNTALTNILDEGLDKQIARYKECAAILRKGMRDMGLKFLLPDDQMANTVTSVFLPEGKNVDQFIAELGEDGYTVYAGKGIFYERNMIQVANMGEIYPEDCYKFLECFRKHI